MAEQPVRRRAASRSTALVALRNPEEICLEAPDHSVVRRSAVQFFQLRNSRDPQSQAARLAEQFVAQNRVPLAARCYDVAGL